MIISYGIREVEQSDLPESDKKILFGGGGSLNPPSFNTFFLLESSLSQEGVNWIIQRIYKEGYEHGYVSAKDT